MKVNACLADVVAVVILEVISDSLCEQAWPGEAANRFAGVLQGFPFVVGCVEADIVDHLPEKCVAGTETEAPLNNVAIRMEESICGNRGCWQLAPVAFKADEPMALLLYKLL